MMSIKALTSASSVEHSLPASRSKYRPTISVALICLCGCPLGTPNDHYRPHGHQDTRLAISPKDDAILFNAAGKGGRDLYLLRIADKHVSRVAETPEYETSPSFSPDGSRIVYSAGVPGDRADHIFTISRDGIAKTQLTHADANDASPRFSPDGSTIVFARDKTYTWGGLAANWSDGGVICVIGADGTGELQLTPDDSFAYAPSFAHDGKAVFFCTTNGLFSVAIDGSEPPKKVGPFMRDATFSSKEALLVYSDGKYSADQELFVANLDGTNKSRITSSKNGCVHPVLSSRGDRIYFLMEEWPKGPSGVPKSSIWTVKSDGSQQEQVTDTSLFDAPLNWKPPLSP